MLYLLFAGQISVAELLAGAVIAGLAALYQAAVRYNSERPLRFRVAALWPLIPATGTLLRDTVTVGRALAFALLGKAPAGGVRVIEPPAGANRNSPCGRAIAVAAVSLAPNSYVVASVFEAGDIVVHRLVDDDAEHRA